MAQSPSVVAVKGVDTLYRVNGGSACTFATALSQLRLTGLGRTEARALLFDAAQRAAAPPPQPANPISNAPAWSRPWTNPT